MARERMVTRTIVTTEVKALCINIDTAEVSTRDFVLTSLIKDEKTMINNAQVQCEDNIKVVAIKEVTEHETLYGMTEYDFLKYAKVLPPR